jgi:hypothetical protein
MQAKRANKKKFMVGKGEDPAFNRHTRWKKKAEAPSGAVLNLFTNAYEP